MLDALTPIADLDLLLSPGDEAEFVACCDWRTPTGAVEASTLFVVLHRRYGLWTHGYRVVSGRQAGRLLVYVVRTAEGDQRGEMRAWLSVMAGS